MYDNDDGAYKDGAYSDNNDACNDDSIDFTLHSPHCLRHLRPTAH